MLHDPWFYAVAIPAMILLGLAKGGFASMGMLAVPLLALVISPVQAAGITLPILILSDLVAIISYWGGLRPPDCADHIARFDCRGCSSAG